MLRQVGRTLAFCVLILTPLNLLSQSSPAVIGEDTQIWSDFYAFHPLDKDMDLLLDAGLRLGRSASHPVYERVGAGFSFKFGKYITLAPFYHYYATQPVAGQDERENRISLEATVGVPLGRWTLSDRNRFERRFRDPKDSTRYRTVFQLERQMKAAHIPFRVFAWDEVLYDWSFNAWVRNRVSVGAGKNLNDKVFLDIYYVRQNGDRRVGDLHAVGFMLRTRF